MRIRSTPALLWVLLSLDSWGDSQHLFSSNWPLDFKLSESPQILDSKKEEGVWPKRKIAGELKSIQVRIDQWVERLPVEGDCGIYRSNLSRFSERIGQHILRVLGNPIILAQEELRVQNMETHLGSLVPLLSEKCLGSSPNLNNGANPDKNLKMGVQLDSTYHFGSGTSVSLDSGLRNHLSLKAHYQKPFFWGSFWDLSFEPDFQLWKSHFLWGGFGGVKLSDSKDSNTQSYLGFDFKRSTGVWSLNRDQNQQLTEFGPRLKYRPVVNRRPLTFGAGFSKISSGSENFISGLVYDFHLEGQMNPSELQSQHSLVFWGEILKANEAALYPSTQNLKFYYKLQSVLLRGGKGELNFGIQEIRDSTSGVGLFPYLKIHFEDAPLGVRGTPYPLIKGKITAITSGFKNFAMTYGQEASLKSSLGFKWSKNFEMDLGGEVKRQTSKSDLFVSSNARINSIKVFVEPQFVLGSEKSKIKTLVAFEERFYSGSAPETLNQNLWVFPLGNAREFILGGIWTYEF